MTAAFAALIILLHVHGLLLIAGTAMALLLVDAIFRTIKVSFVPSRFLRMQQRGIRRVVGSGALQDAIAPADELRSVEIQKFSRQQQATFAQSLANGVIAHRVLNYWAYQLEKYRRSPASVLFNALAYFWLIARSILALAFINLALHYADATAFSYRDDPTFLVFVRYVIAGLYGGEIDALHPASDLASAISIATFGVGLIVVGSLAISSALGFRAARDESEIRETIAEIQSEGDRLDQRLRDESQVSVVEAIERLEQLRFGLMGLITFFSTRIPRDFEHRSRDADPRRGGCMSC